MTKQKLKILFIPADNIEANISRSYFFAKGLAKYSDLYYVTWKDFRTEKWLGGKLSKWNTLHCFFSSLFAKFKVYKNEKDSFTRVNCSVFIDAFVGRILGRIRGKKIMRKHNAKTLNKLINNLNPNVIFFADSSYYFPALERTNLLQICDLQDDIDWEEFSKSLQKIEKTYLKEQYQKFDLHYIVSENAKKSIAKNIENFPFKVIYNGADFKELQKDYRSEIQSIKEQYNLQDKYIISHIGSATWVDPNFTRLLFNEIYKRDKSIILILVGNMPKINLPNVINIGMVSAEESYIYYNITDLAILLKDSIGSSFLYNSVPLKNIQYAAVKKPVITFPIQWLEKEHFSNTTIINNIYIEEWISKIQEIRNNFQWTANDDFQWRDYNWDNICNMIFEEIKINLKKKTRYPTIAS